MTEEPISHGIVLGGSAAGLFAARVLSHYAERVTLVERDALPDTAEHRKGTPQSHHANNLLPRAMPFFDAWFPSLVSELRQAGAVPVADEGRVVLRGVRLARTRGAPVTLLLTRPLLDAVLRRQVRALDNVTFATGHDVTGLCADGSSVTGVTARSADGETTLKCDLVVDAMGRGTRARRWLAALGHAEPPVTEMQVNVRYASYLFSRAPDDLEGDKLLLISPTADNPRGGVAFAVEADRWLVTLFAYGGEAPPTDLSGFRAFMSTLVTNDLAALLARASPVSDPASYVYPSACLRRFDDLRVWPDGYVCLGDSLCHLNPSYGSGLTSAALQAEALARALEGGRHAFPQRYYRLAVKAASLPFAFTWSADLDIPSVQGPPAPIPAPIRRYLMRAMRVGGNDPAVALALRRVIGLLDPPPTLLRPSMAFRVLFGRVSPMSTQ